MGTIVATQRGSYDSYVRLEGEEQSRNMLELLNNLVGPTGSVAGYFTVSGWVGEGNSSDEFLYGPTSPPERLLFVPSLEDLGYSAATHKLQAVIFGNFRQNSDPGNVEFRLVNAAGAGVPGSTATGLVTEDGQDEVLKSAAFDILPEAGYQVDFKSVDGENIDLYSRLLFIRVVKL